MPDVPIEYFDERFTSVLAHQAMIDGGLKKKARQDKGLVDEISATIILEDYLSASTNTPVAAAASVPVSVTLI